MVNQMIPNNLEGLFNFSTACSCGKIHSVDLQGASIRKNALEDVLVFMRTIGRSLSIAVIMDQVTKSICGDRVIALLSKGGYKIVKVIIPHIAGVKPHANEEGLHRVAKAIENVDAAVAVGCGTINDLTKLASFQRGIPYLVVVTAPSMNGFTSAIAAISLGGIKCTIQCHQPFAVVADLSILMQAPMHLITSGLGDLESKPTCTADFQLAGLLHNDYYCSVPEQIVSIAEKKVADSAEGLRFRDPKSIHQLMEALLISGISMKMAGSSSPASGGEHLISHYWDMTAAQQGRTEGYHGAQVGVATIVTASLYDFLKAISPDSIHMETIVQKQPSRQDQYKIIQHHFGTRAKAVSEEFFKKYQTKEHQIKMLNAIRSNWDTIWSKLESKLRPVDSIRHTLHSAGCPVTIQELGLTPTHLKESFYTARYIRNRYTVLDFAADLGVLQEHGPQILKMSGCL